MLSNNQQVPFTIRTLPAWVTEKQKKKDSKVTAKLIHAWDKLQDKDMVLDIFLKYQSTLSDFRYWEFLRTVWILSGGYNTQDTFRKLFNSKRKFRNWFMTPEEEQFLKKLPEEIVVHRAYNKGEEDGFAWTISSDYVQEYKLRFSKQLIRTKKINKSEVYAYINRNKEQEILILN